MTLDRSHIRARLLLQDGLDPKVFTEAKLLDISPGGKLKLKYATGETIWCEPSDIIVAEVLPQRAPKSRKSHHQRRKKQ